MHVELRLPESWDVELAPDGRVRATSPSAPGIEIVTAPFIVMTDRKMSWAQTIMSEQLGAPFAALRLRVDEKGETVDGWPTWFAVAERDDGEVRSFAFYHFLDYSSYAMIRGDEADLHLDLLRRARPNYATDQIVALEQLWE